MDYSKVGLRAGLEVHQQLDTAKLFCRCPSVLSDEKPDFVVKRFLRPFASEFGEHDEASLDASSKKLSFFYEGFFGSTCEVELDEAPPREIDQGALNAVLEFAVMAKAKIFDNVIVMRKNIIDGSNVSSFQRTALVAVNGALNVNGKQIPLETIILEEDSARPIERKDGQVIYRVDRLGVPLIEIATAPELFSPLEVKQTALEIGKLLRLAGKTKRGLGTIRQDVNISIREGQRVEIKGVQDLENIDKFVENEVQRQIGLVEVKNELSNRGCSKKSFEGLTSLELFELTNPVSFLKGKKLAVIKLPFFGGLLGKELSQNRRLGTELADYVRSKSSAKGIIHSDEALEKTYGFSKEEQEKIKELVKAGSLDGFVLVAGDTVLQCKKILESIVVSRAKYCLVGVPKETRDALEDFNTKYSRPLAGSARMYPETDLRQVIISSEMLSSIKKNLPLNESQRQDLYIKKFGLSEKLASEMKLNNYARFFEDLCAKGYEPKKLAVFLLETLTSAKRQGVNIENLSRERLIEILEQIRLGKITREIEIEVLKEAILSQSKSVSEIVDKKFSKSASVDDVVKKIIEKNKDLISAKGQGAFSALMGEAMQELKGTASGKEVSDSLKKHLKMV